MLEQQRENNLLKLKREVPVMPFYWVLIPSVCMLLAYLVCRAFWTGWFLIPFMFFIASANLYAESIRRQRCLARIDRIRLDPLFWQRFGQLYPDVGLRERRLIEQGFKDYLSLHGMSCNPYAMPSHAVDALWHVMLEFPVQYQHLCRQAIGRVLKHRPYDNKSKNDQNEQLQQLCEAWRYSCMLNGLDPRTTTMLPRLFAIDSALNWPNRQVYTVESMQEQYRQYLKNQSDSSSGGCSSCSSCGGD